MKIPKAASFVLSGLLLFLGCLSPGRSQAPGEEPSRHGPLPILLDMVHDNPGEPKQPTAFRDPAFLARLGYTGQVPRWFVQCALTYDAFDPGAVPKGSPARAWMAREEARVKAGIAAAHQAGLKVYPFTDILVIPISLREKYDKEIGNWNIHRPMVRKLVRAQVEEIFRRFPGLDGLVLRFGETYLNDTPFHCGRSPVRSPEDHTILLKLLREEVCVKRGKRLFYRTWDFGNRFHVNPKFYRAATDPVPPHPNLFFSIKHTRGDFLRTLPFNPTIGIGKHRQIVEVQCQREYEGKGAHPDYIARGVIEGFPEYRNAKRPKCLRDLLGNPRFAGVWTWSRGGGWRGPYLKNEFWCALNARVLSRWARDPGKEEEVIFRDYAVKDLGLEEGEARLFRKLCLLSAEGVLLGQYCSYAGVPLTWARDQYMAGLDRLRGTFRALIRRNRVEEALAEKDEAVAVWERIEALSRRIHFQDPKTEDYVRVSCSYGRIKYGIFRDGWTILLLGTAAGGKPGAALRDRMARALRDYDGLWREWKALKASHPSCATLYSPDYCRYVPQKGMLPAPGMKTSIDRFRKILADR